MSGLLLINGRNKWENQYIKKKNRKKGVSNSERSFRKHVRSSNSMKGGHYWRHSIRDTQCKHDRSKRMVNMKYHKDICIDLVAHDHIHHDLNDDMISMTHNPISVWICSKCTYRNIERKMHCKVCNFPYHKTSATNIINGDIDKDDIDMVKLEDLISNGKHLLFDDYYYKNTNNDDDEMLSVAVELSLKHKQNISVDTKPCKDKKITDIKNKNNKNGKNKETSVSNTKHSAGFDAYIRHKNRDKINTEYGSISPYIEYLICYLRPILPTKKEMMKLIKGYDEKAQIEIECVLNQEYIKRFYDNFANDNGLKHCTSGDLKNISNNIICNDKMFDFYIVHSQSIPKVHYNQIYYYSQQNTYMNDNEIARCFGQNLLVYGYIRRLYMEYYGFEWIIPNEINIICLDYYNHDITPRIKNHSKHPQYQPYDDKTTYINKWSRKPIPRKYIEHTKCHNVQNSLKNIEWQYHILKTQTRCNRFKIPYTYSYCEHHHQYMNLIMWPKDRYFSDYPMSIPYYSILPIYKIGIKKGKGYLDDVMEIDKWLIPK